MSQIGSHPPASGNLEPKVRPHRQVVLRRIGYAGAGYLLVLTAAEWIGGTPADGETYLYLAVPAFGLTFLAAITARGRARLGWRPNRRMWRNGENSIRYGWPTADVVVDASRRLTNEGSPLPTWIRAEPRWWHFAPLVFLAFWTLVAVFRAS